MNIEFLYKEIDEFNLTCRTRNCLSSEGIYYLGELVQKTEDEMLSMYNFGRKSLNELKRLLYPMELGFGMKVENFDLDKYRTDKQGAIENTKIISSFFIEKLEQFLDLQQETQKIPNKILSLSRELKQNQNQLELFLRQIKTDLQIIGKIK